MTPPDPSSATPLLERWRSGDDLARAELLGLLHDEMRAIARRLMRHERRGHTLQPTAVVNEACLRLLGVREGPARTPGEFLGLAARVMRQVLVDHARQRDASKRAGDWQRVSLSVDAISDDSHDGLIDALDLDAALAKLEGLNPRQAQVAELRYFGGLTIPETAEVLGIGTSAVKADWVIARSWLQRELESAGAP